MISAKAKARRARDTRWLYRIEREDLKLNKEATKNQSIRELRELAIKIWNKEAPNKKFSIVAGNGVRYIVFDGNKEWCSYCETPGNRIVLARQQRNILVMLHELTHALGALVHGPKFIKLYFRLLNKYAGYSRIFLQTVASERGITLA